MERRDKDSSVLQRISEAPAYAGNNPERVLAGVDHIFQQALGLPPAERTDKLKEVLPMVQFVLSSKPSPETAVEAHLARLSISFELVRGTTEVPDNVALLRQFSIDSFNYLIEESPINALRFLRVPLSGSVCTDDLKGNLAFTDWGIVASNKALGRSEITMSAKDMAYVVRARKDLIKKRNNIIMQRKNRSN